MPKKPNKKRVLCLYGTDKNGIPVCMFFDKMSHLKQFIDSLPGNYDTLKLRGMGYDDFTIV